MSVSPPTILLVDDDPDARLLLHRFLQALPHLYALLSVASGPEALAVLASRPIALVITDYEMPGMNGLALARAVKATSPTTRVAIVTVHDSADIARTVGTEVDAVLAKPYDLRALQQLVASL